MTSAALARVAAATVAVVLAGTTVAPAAGAVTARAAAKQLGVDATRASGPGLYIVTLTGRPAAAAVGGDGRRFDRTRPEVTDHAEALTRAQDEILEQVGEPEVSYRFTTALNGFVAKLSTRQVKQLRRLPTVELVEKSSKVRLDNVGSPDFLDLTGPDGVWERTGGPDDAGKGLVVGVVDSGIWPENPSFAGVPLRTPGEAPGLPGFHGACDPAEQWTESDCNSKVVSARYFVEGFGKLNVAKSEYLSPRDGSGHGSHTASTAAGNDSVAVDIEGQEFPDASGVAPAARIAAYKACWAAPNPEDDGCTTADTVAAIDRAVGDGVDVINYSIAGSAQTVGDSVQRAFLNAATAGVFVATSAGNEGPGVGSVSHPGPWVTTVGASTYHRLQGAVRLEGDTAAGSLVGAMVADRSVPSTGIVLAADVAASTASPEQARLCENGSLDAGEVQGKIVVCDRGVNARVEKSKAVARAGGVAMVLVNTDPDSLDADLHAVPTVHVDSTAGATIKEYVEDLDQDARASIDPAGSDDTRVPQVAGFSSRGPSAAVGGDLLKPDLTAPGVSVVAAVAPSSDSGRLWDLRSGSSMSAAHVAGLAALVMAEKPSWTPAEVKSAMMTTAYDLEGPNGVFAQGAGHVDPTDMLDPGLVYGAVDGQWTDLVDGRIVPSDVNLPSIAVGRLVGRNTVTRTVTNVSGRPATFNADVTGLKGVDVTVRPSRLLLRPNESATFKVRFRARPDAELGSYAKGALTWTGLNGHDVRIPVAVRPELVKAPRQVSAEGSAGSVTITGRAGTGSRIELSTAGLVGALPTPVSLTPGRFDPDRPAEGDHTLKTSVEVPPGTEVVRFQVDGNNPGDDLDLFVYRAGELVGLAAGQAADESVTLTAPQAGRYDVYTSSSSAANGSTTTGQLFSWVVGDGDTGAVELSPDRVDAPAGAPFSVRATWDVDELDLTQRWFGAIRYGTSDRRTFVAVN